jgi:hypothetical protein
MTSLKTPNRSELRQALASLRAAGYPDKTPSKDPLKTLFSGPLNRALMGPFDPSTDESMAVFFALAQGGKAFEKALDQHPRWIDATLAEAARPQGTKEADAPPAGVAIFADFTPMHFCAQQDLSREARALLARGVDPGRFTARVTSTGLAAYSGSARTLAEIRAFGFDLRLELDPDHCAPSSGAARSTLLHRMATRNSSDAGFDACARILAGSRVWYPDLDCETEDGATPLDWAGLASPERRAIFAQAVLSEKARRETEALEASSSPQRKRARPKAL